MAEIVITNSSTRFTRELKNNFINISVEWSKKGGSGKTWRGIKNPIVYMRYLNKMLNRDFSIVATKYGNFAISLQRKQMEKRFRVGGIETGQTVRINERWEPLSGKRIRERIKDNQWMGDGTSDRQPILRATGKGRKSIGVLSKTAKKGMNPNMVLRYGLKGAPYMKKHHFGDPNNKYHGKSAPLPERRFSGLSIFQIMKLRRFAIKRINIDVMS